MLGDETTASPMLNAAIASQENRCAKGKADNVMDHTGDTRHQFDPADVSAVAEAEDGSKN